MNSNLNAIKTLEGYVSESLNLKHIGKFTSQGIATFYKISEANTVKLIFATLYSCKNLLAVFLF